MFPALSSCGDKLRFKKLSQHSSPGSCRRPSMDRRNMGPSQAWKVWFTRLIGVKPRHSLKSPLFSSSLGLLPWKRGRFCVSRRTLVTCHRHMLSWYPLIASARDATRPKLHFCWESGSVYFTVLPPVNIYIYTLTPDRDLHPPACVLAATSERDSALWDSDWTKRIRWPHS